MHRLRPDISAPNIPQVPKISGDGKEQLVPSTLQRHDTEDKSYLWPGLQSLSCSRCPKQGRGGGGALREQAKRRKKNTAKTSLSDPTQECPENLRLKVGGSGRETGAEKHCFQERRIQRRFWKEMW